MKTVQRVLVAASVVAGTIAMHAQIQNPIQAAKDAYNKAKQQSQQQQQQQQQQPARPAAQTQQQAAASGPAASGSTEPGDDCCTPDAMRKVAASVGFLDIAGIKLGMTPEQAFSAVKVFNARMKIDIVNTRLETPDGPQGSFKRVPRYAVAHTVGPIRYPADPPPFYLADGSADEIVLEFSIPPSPPLVIKITRQVTFATGQPVLASNLISALEKKYGETGFVHGNSREWAFAGAAKPVTRLSPALQSCLPAGPLDGFEWGGGAMPNAGDVLTDAVGISLSTTDPLSGYHSPQRDAQCSPYTMVETDNLGEGTRPDAKMSSMTVTIQSPALMYASARATREWLESKANGKQKQLDDAAKDRSAPKL